MYQNLHNQICIIFLGHLADSVFSMSDISVELAVDLELAITAFYKCH